MWYNTNVTIRNSDGEYTKGLRRRNNNERDRTKLYFQGSPVKAKHLNLKRAAVLGADVPKEVERLMEEKKIALKKGDTELAKKIRKQLRSLDYKRYLRKEK